MLLTPVKSGGVREALFHSDHANLKACLERGCSHEKILQNERQDKIEKEEQFCLSECKNFSDSGSLRDFEVHAPNILNASIYEEEEDDDDETLLELFNNEDSREKLLINFSKDGKNAQTEIKNALKEEEKKEQSESYHPSDPNDSSQRKKEDKDKSDRRKFHEKHFLEKKYKEEFYGLTQQMDDNIHDILFLEGLKFYLTFIHVLNPNKANQDINLNLDGHIALLSFLSEQQEEQKRTEHERTLKKVLKKSKQIIFGLKQFDENQLVKQVILRIQEESFRLGQIEEVIKFQEKLQNIDSQKLADIHFIPKEILELIFNKSIVINNWSLINDLLKEFLNIKKLNQIEVDKKLAKTMNFVDINVVCADLECQIVGQSMQNSKKQSSQQSSIHKKDLSLSRCSLKNQSAQSIPTFDFKYAVPIFNDQCAPFCQSVLGSQDEFKTFSEMFSKCHKDCDHKVDNGHSEIALACFLRVYSNNICRTIATKFERDSQYSQREIERVDFRLPLYSTRDTCINCDYSLSHPWTEIKDCLLWYFFTVLPLKKWSLKDTAETNGIQKAMTFTLENPKIQKLAVENYKSFRNFNFCCDRSNPRGFFKANFLIKVLTDLNDAKVQKLALKQLRSLAKELIEKDSNLKKFARDYHQCLDSIPLLPQKQNLKYVSPSRTFFLNYSLKTNVDERLTQQYKEIGQQINLGNELRRNMAASIIQRGFFKSKLRSIFSQLRKNKENKQDFDMCYHKLGKSDEMFAQTSKIADWLTVQCQRDYDRAFKAQSAPLKQQHSGDLFSNKNLYEKLCYVLTKLFFMNLLTFMRPFSRLGQVVQNQGSEKKMNSIDSIDYVFEMLYQFRVFKMYQLIHGRDLKVDLTKEERKKENLESSAAEVYIYEKWLWKMKNQ